MKMVWILGLKGGGGRKVREKGEKFENMREKALINNFNFYL
jgi:hypothetical protein